VLGGSADHQPGLGLVAVRFLFAVTLISITGLLVTAAFGTRYRTTRRAGTAGCTGITMPDTAMS
jgi:hypothetical protein